MPNGIPFARVLKEEVPLAQSGTPSIQIHQVQSGQSLALISYLYSSTRAQAVVLINCEDDYNLPDEVAKTASQSVDIPLLVLRRAHGDELLRALEEMPPLHCEIAVISNPDCQVSSPAPSKFRSKESREKRGKLTGKLLDKSLWPCLEKLQRFMIKSFRGSALSFCQITHRCLDNHG